MEGNEKNNMNKQDDFCGPQKNDCRQLNRISLQNLNVKVERNQFSLSGHVLLQLFEQEKDKSENLGVWYIQGKKERGIN